MFVFLGGGGGLNKIENINRVPVVFDDDIAVPRPTRAVLLLVFFF